MEEAEPLQQITVEQLFIHSWEKKNLILNLTPYIKINLKMDHILSVKCTAIRLLEKKIGENHLDLGLSNQFLDLTPKA